MNEIENIQLFNEKFRKLVRSSFVKYINKNGLRFSFDTRKNRKKRDHKIPGEKSIDGFVLTIRFFLQNKDLCSIGNINKFYQNIDNNDFYDLKQTVNENISTLNQYLDTKFPFKINGTSLSHRELLNGYIYTELAHNDKERHKKFVSCYEPDNKPGKNLIEIYFCIICVNIVEICKQIYICNKELLKRLNS